MKRAEDCTSPDASLHIAEVHTVTWASAALPRVFPCALSQGKELARQAATVIFPTDKAPEEDPATRSLYLRSHAEYAPGGSGSPHTVRTCPQEVLALKLASSWPSSWSESLDIPATKSTEGRA